MPTTKFQRFIFALITTIITVNCFVFYCLSISHSGMSIDIIKEGYSLSTWLLPIPIVLLELIFALSLELLIGSPLSMKMAFKIVNPREEKPFITETLIICCTVCIMCPLMSFVATILYNFIPALVHGTSTLDIALLNIIPQFLQTVVINFPFALLTQLFFIQPLVRKIFGLIFKKKSEQNEFNKKEISVLAINESN